MTGDEISRFVDRLEAGEAAVADFRKLSAHDWDEVKGLLEARRRFNTQKYVNALFACRLRAEAERTGQKRTYSEAEILTEFGGL